MKTTIFPTAVKLGDRCPVAWKVPAAADRPRCALPPVCTGEDGDAAPEAVASRAGLATWLRTAGGHIRAAL